VGIPWKKIFSFGLAGAAKVLPFLSGRFGSVTGAILDGIHSIEDAGQTLGLTGAQKALHVEGAGFSAINAAFVAAGKQPIISDALREKQRAFVEAGVALENQIAKEIHDAHPIAPTAPPANQPGE
jgi:hypothetical protein